MEARNGRSLRREGVGCMEIAWVNSSSICFALLALLLLGARLARLERRCACLLPLRFAKLSFAMLLNDDRGEIEMDTCNGNNSLPRVLLHQPMAYHDHVSEGAVGTCRNQNGVLFGFSSHHQPTSRPTPPLHVHCRFWDSRRVYLDPQYRS